MISKFERDQSEISISRFFHLLDKIHVRAAEFDLAKNMFSRTGFESLLHKIQMYVIEENFGKLEKLADIEFIKWQQSKDSYSYLNFIMVIAIISDHQKKDIPQEDLDFLTDYLFKCENWGLYELTLYTNCISVLPINTILVFSRSLPQKILLLRDSTSILNTAINAIINTLILCIEHNKVEEGFFFIKVLDDFHLTEVMLFERMLFNLYKGIFFTTFTEKKQLGEKLVQDSLLILKLSNSDSLYDILLSDSNRLLFHI